MNAENITIKKKTLLVAVIILSPVIKTSVVFWMINNTLKTLKKPSITKSPS